MDVKYRDKTYVKVAYRKFLNLKKKLKATTLTNNALKKTNTELVKKIQELKEMLKVTENKCEILMAEQAQTMSSAQLVQGKFLQLISKIYEAISINAFNDGVPLIPHFPSFTFPMSNNENVSCTPSTSRVSAVGTSFVSSGSGYRPTNNINHILSPISENDATGSPVQRKDLQVNSTSPNVTSTSGINNVNTTPEGVEQMANERTEDVAQSQLSIAYVKTVPHDLPLKREVEELTEQVSIQDTDELLPTVIDETCQEKFQTQPSPNISTCSKQETLTNDNIPNFSNVAPSTLEIPASLSTCSKQEIEMNANDSLPNFSNVIPRRRKALSPQSSISPQTPTSPPPSISTQPQICSLPSTSSQNIENETTQESSIPIPQKKKNNFRPIIVKIEGPEVNDEVLHVARESSFDISGNFKITSTPSTTRIASVCALVTGSPSTSSQRASRITTNPVTTDSLCSSPSQRASRITSKAVVTELTGSPSAQSTRTKRKLNTDPEQSASEDELNSSPNLSDLPLFERITRNSKSTSPDKSRRSQFSPRSGRRLKKSHKLNSKNSTFSSTLSNESNGPRSRRARIVNYKEPPCNRSFKNIAPMTDSHKISSTSSVWYCSVCEQSKKIAMIQCLKCKHWLHIVCAKVSYKQKTFYCSPCRVSI